MRLNKHIPYAIAGFVFAVGVFFCISAFMDGVFVDTEPPGSHFLIGVSSVFIGAGVYSLYLLRRGKLKESGGSIVEVRQRAVKKMKDPVLLARIASGDEALEIRETAQRRLEELNN